MQAAVKNKAWNSSVPGDNEFRLQSIVTANFTNGRSETLSLGLPNMKHVEAVSKK